jgi:hypothetical protein
MRYLLSLNVEVFEFTCTCSCCSIIKGGLPGWDASLTDVQVMHNFLTNTICAVGEALNPYVSMSPGLAAMRKSLKISQLLDMLRHLFAEEHDVHASVILGILARAESVIKQLQAEVHRQLKGELGDGSMSVICHPDLNQLIGLLAVSSGFSLGLAPGSQVSYKSSRGAMSEECVVLGGDTANTPFGDLLKIVPLTEKAIDVRVHVDTHTVFKDVIEGRSCDVIPLEVFKVYVGNEDLICRVLQSAISLDTIDSRPDLAREAPIRKTVILEFESIHPYNDNTDFCFEVSIPGAEEIIIQFDPRSRTEANYDFIKFYKDSTQTLTWGAEKYSGTSGWPGAAGYIPCKDNAHVLQS